MYQIRPMPAEYFYSDHLAGVLVECQHSALVRDYAKIFRELCTSFFRLFTIFCCFVRNNAARPTIQLTSQANSQIKCAKAKRLWRTKYWLVQTNRSSNEHRAYNFDIVYETDRIRAKTMTCQKINICTDVRYMWRHLSFSLYFSLFNVTFCISTNYMNIGKHIISMIFLFSFILFRYSL